MRPLEASSWSFTDSKPRMKIEYDAKHTHEWTIGEFSKKMQMEVGQRLESSTFSIKVGNKIILWCVRIYPNGKTDADIGHISAYLVKASNAKLPLDVKYTLSVVDLKGFKSNSRTKESTFIEPNDYGYGLKKYISHTNLMNLISDDTITRVI